MNFPVSWDSPIHNNNSDKKNEMRGPRSILWWSEYLGASFERVTDDGQSTRNRCTGTRCASERSRFYLEL